MIQLPSDKITPHFQLLWGAAITALGGGGLSFFSSYVGSGPAPTLHPQKYQEFQAPQKIFEILAAQKIPPILYLDLKKRNIAQFCDDP